MISRKTSAKDIIRKLLYADDLAPVADSEADQERTLAGKEIFGKHGWIVSPEKMEALWVGQQKKNLDIREETETPRQLCIPGWSGLWGRRHGDGNSKNASCGEFVEESGSACEVLAYLCRLETVAMTETQQRESPTLRNIWVSETSG